MRRKIIFIYVCILSVLALFVTVDFGLKIDLTVEGATITVDDSGGADYLTIQEAIDAAGDGDTVYVFQGTYYENVLVNKRIHLQGENKTNTVIDGGGVDNTVTVTADLVNLTQLKITNAKGGGLPEDYAGVWVLSDGNTISDNDFTLNLEHALYLSSSDGNTICDNTFTWNGAYGLYLDNSNWSYIEHNTLDTNGQGIYLGSCSNNTLMDNYVTYHGGDGITLHESHENKIINNNITDNYSQFVLGFSDRNLVFNNTITRENGMAAPAYGILLGTSNDNNITGNKISKNLYGVYGDILENNLIFDNQIFHNTVGVDFRQAVSNDILSCNVSNNQMGIIIQSSSEWNNISKNTVSNNYDLGIVIAAAGNSNITGNTMINNGYLGGLILEDSTYNVLRNNSMLYDSVYITGDLVEYWNTHDIDTTNTVDGKPIRYIKDQIGGMIPIYSGQVILANCTNVLVEGQDISKGAIGMLLGFSSGNSIKNNMIHDNRDVGFYLSKSDQNMFNDNLLSDNYHPDSMYGRGFHLDNSRANEISDNIAKNHRHGIYLDHSEYNNITHNKAFSNNYAGILLATSNGNNITKNRCYSNIDGIKIWKSTNNTIAENHLTDNTKGILVSISNNNTIDNNTIMYNNAGILFSSSNENNFSYNLLYSNNFGISVGQDPTSEDNHIYRNTLLQNPNQASDKGVNTHWNKSYPIGGNYWSDYTGLDLFKGSNQDIPGSDGIGDTPYDIEPTSQDHYPLMSPSVNFTFLNAGLNLISIPNNHESTDLDDVLFTMDGSYINVQCYDSTDKTDPWKHFHSSKPSHMNDLSSLDHTMAFWVEITEPEGVPFKYTGPQPTQNQNVQLYKGWNMVGYPSLSNKDRTNALNNLIFDTHVDSIWAYNSTSEKWKEIGSSDYLELGKGYWIHATQDCDWEVPL